MVSFNQEALRPIRFLNFMNQNPEIDGRYFLMAENRNQKSGLRKSEIWNLKSEIWNPKSKIRKRKSEIRNQKTENGNQKSENENRKSEIGNRKSEIGNRKSEIGNQKSEIRKRKTEIRNQKSEIRNQKSEMGNRKSEIRNQKSKIRLSKGKWRDVITLQPSSQDHDKKTQPRSQSSSAISDVTSPIKLVGKIRLGRLANNGKSKMAASSQECDFSQDSWRNEKKRRK